MVTPPMPNPTRAPDAPDGPAVILRLEEAGRTLLALPHAGWQSLRSTKLDILRAAVEGYGREATISDRPPIPDAAAVARMDEAFAWLLMIPQDRYVLRRIVGARCMVSPVTGRHLYPWRRLATLLGADLKAIKRWHAEGIAIVIASLRARAAGA